MTCPVPSAHRRLDDAHAAWHDALDAYSDPHGFRRHFNTFLAAFGSARDLIERQKRRLPNGQSKLSVWEQEARKVPYAKWAKNSRNLVIHENDLSLHSFAEVEHVDTRTFTRKGRRMRLDPKIGTYDLLQAFVRNVPPHMEDGIIAVTRKWMANTLPHAELLAVGSALFDLLLSLIKTFHEENDGCAELDLPTRSCMSGERDFSRPSCMVAISPTITRYYDLNSRQEIELGVGRIELKDPDMRVLEDRYGHVSSISGDPIEVAARQMKMASIFVTKDSEVLPWMILLKEGKVVEVFPVDMPSRAGRAIMHRVIAQRIRAVGADGFVFNGEAWTDYRRDAKRPIHRHEKTHYDIRPERGEVIVVNAASRDGRQLTMVREINRNEAGWPSLGGSSRFVGNGLL